MERKEWYKSFSLPLCLLGLLAVIGIFFYLLTRETLGVSDAILLTLISILISAGVSFYFGRYFSYEQALSRIEGEATKALRRIVRIKDSTLRLLDNCERIIAEVSLKYKGKGEQKLLLEYFEGIRRGLLDLAGNVDSSIDDWGDMLKEEVQALKRAELEQSEFYEKKLKERDAILEKYKKLLKEAKEEDKGRLLEELNEKFEEFKGELRRGLAKIREETSPSIPPPTITPSGVTGSSQLTLPRFKSVIVTPSGGVDES